MISKQKSQKTWSRWEFPHSNKAETQVCLTSEMMVKEEMLPHRSGTTPGSVLTISSLEVVARAVWQEKQ